MPDRQLSLRARPSLTPQMLGRPLAPGRYYDGGDDSGGADSVRGLYLDVGKSGATSWRQRVTVRGRRHTVGLGSYPLVSFAGARGLGLDNLRLAAAGVDPVSARQRGIEPTFRLVADWTVAQLRERWTSAREETDWRRSLARHVFPVVGDWPVSSICESHCLALLGPLALDRPRLARSLRVRIARVFAVSIDRGWRTDNPAAAALRGSPRDGAPIPRSALAPGDVAGALRVVRDSRARRSTRLAFELVVLTATWPGQACGALWSEIDLAAALWTLAPERVKSRRAVRIPLSGAACLLFRRAIEVAQSPYVCPASWSGVTGSVLPVTVSAMLRRAGIPAQPHGFRRTFEVWCAERGVAADVVAACLQRSVRGAAVSARAGRRLEASCRRVFESWSRHVQAAGAVGARRCRGAG
jgi:integrase